MIYDIMSHTAPTAVLQGYSTLYAPYLAFNPPGIQPLISAPAVTPAYLLAPLVF